MEPRVPLKILPENVFSLKEMLKGRYLVAQIEDIKYAIIQCSYRCIELGLPDVAVALYKAESLLENLEKKPELLMEKKHE